MYLDSLFYRDNFFRKPQMIVKYFCNHYGSYLAIPLQKYYTIVTYIQVMRCFSVTTDNIANMFSQITCLFRLLFILVFFFTIILIGMDRISETMIITFNA